MVKFILLLRGGREKKGTREKNMGTRVSFEKRGEMSFHSRWVQRCGVCRMCGEIYTTGRRGRRGVGG